jgi:pimeloyl-ACP methyl ester carboxylesterase
VSLRTARDLDAAGDVTQRDNRAPRHPAGAEPLHEAAIDGYTVRFLDTGDVGSGHSVVLVHGLGASSRYFLPLVRELRADARVVALDLPGFGDSSRPLGAPSIPALARVVSAVIDETGVTTPVLVGHSMGCQVVAEIAVQRPDIPRGLVLVGPTVDPGKHGIAWHFLMLAVNSLLEPWPVNRVLVAEYARAGMRQYLKALRPMLAHRIEHALALAETRAVVVRGTRDTVALHRWAASASRLLPNGRLLEIPGRAHGVHASDAAAIAAVCRELLDD